MELRNRFSTPEASSEMEEETTINSKRVFVEHLASEAEKAAAYGNLGTVYKITKLLCGKFTNHSTHVWDKNGNICTSESDKQPDGFNTSRKYSTSLSQNN